VGYVLRREEKPPKLFICYAPKKPPVQKFEKIQKIQKFWRVTYAEFWRG
jgi:hypothetical protein